jgi:hypothetical protein
MAEIEPASDEELQNVAFALSYGDAIKPEFVRRIIARLRKAEADNAHMARLLAGYHQICSEHGIAPSSSEIYAAADRAGGKADE